MDLTREQVEKKLTLFTDDYKKIDFMNLTAGDFGQFDIEFAEELAQKAYAASFGSNYKKGLAQALMNRAILASNRRDYDRMFDHALEAERWMRSLPDSETLGLHRVISCKGIYHYYRGNYPEAAGYFKEAVVLCRKAGDLSRLGIVTSNLSTMYEKLGQYDKALQTVLEALKEMENSTSFRSIIYALTNAGTYSTVLKQYTPALEYLEQALELARTRGLVDLVPMVLVKKAEVFKEKTEYSQAEDILQQSLTFCREKKDFVEETASLIHLGALYSEAGQLDKAEAALMKALEYVRKYDIHSDEQNLHKYAEELYVKKECYKKAMYHQKQYFELELGRYDRRLDDKIKNFETGLLLDSNRRINVISVLGQEITSNLEMNRIVGNIYSSFNKLMDASFFGILLYNEEKKLLQSELYIKDGELLETFFIDINEPLSINALVFREKRDLIIHDYENEFKHFLPGAETFDEVILKIGKGDRPVSILCAPFELSGQVIGVITASSYKKNCYTVTDLDSLKALGAYVAIALNNASQAGIIREQNRKLSSTNKRFNEDLKLSRELQLAMIPMNFPASPFYKIYGYYNFLDAVGGDLYDVYKIGPDKTAVLILDVVGHGVSAALVTAMAKILFLNKAENYDSASAIVEAVNRELTPITGESFTYCSLFFCIIDETKRTLEYVNAAHPEPFLLKEGKEPLLLGSSSLFLGLKEEYSYEQKAVHLDHRDRLVLFTDGYFELKSNGRKRFGEKRLLEVMVTTKHLKPDDAIEHLNRELSDFRAGKHSGFDDDRMILIVDFN